MLIWTERPHIQGGIGCAIILAHCMVLETPGPLPDRAGESGVRSQHVALMYSFSERYLASQGVLCGTLSAQETRCP